jgi:hypothetical protein
MVEILFDGWIQHDISVHYYPGTIWNVGLFLLLGDLLSSISSGDQRQVNQRSTHRQPTLETTATSNRRHCNQQLTLPKHWINQDLSTTGTLG